MPLELHKLRTMRSALGPILEEAQQDDEQNNRVGIRHPFFRPVTVVLNDGRRCSAFSRDLSVTGIGLLHDTELLLSEVEVSISTAWGYFVKVQTRIIWCLPCGDGWHLSGGQFVSIPEKSDF